MKELKDAARDILGSSSNKSLCKCACLMGRAELFKNDFRDANNAAMDAMSKLTEALSASTFVKVAEISIVVEMIRRCQEKHDQKLVKIEQKVDELDGKGLHQKLDLLLRGQGISEAYVESIVRNVLAKHGKVVSYNVQPKASSATAGLRVKNIAAATELRDEVLKPGGLLAKAGVQGVSVDRGAFLESYAEAVMRFTELTAHQKDRLAEVRDAVVSVLLAPAGSGKTFVAVQRMAEVLNSDPKAKVLFVARNTALALFACKWLVAASRAAQRIVERVHVLVDPFLEGPRRVSVLIDGARLRLAPGKK